MFDWVLSTRLTMVKNEYMSVINTYRFHNSSVQVFLVNSTNFGMQS